MAADASEVLVKAVQARINAAESERIMAEEFAKAVEKDVAAQEKSDDDKTDRRDDE